MTPTVIEIPGAKDPDEALQKEPGIFKKAAREDIGIYDYLFDKTLESVDLESIEGKKQFADQLLPIIATIKNEIIKEHYIKDLTFHYVTDMREVIDIALLNEKVKEPLDLTVKEDHKKEPAGN